VLEAAASGRPVALRNPSAVRPWQHVLNPLAGYLLLAEGLVADPRVHAGGWNFGPVAGDELTVRQVVERLAGMWDGPLEIRAQPGEHPPETGVLRIDSTRARERLGWRPRWDLAAGLEAIVAWAQAHRRGEDVRAVTVEQLRRYAAE
jgi:CDP-glucose 4,6-dehydratase